MFHDSVKPNYDYRANLNKQKKRYKNYDLNSPLTKNRYFAPEKEKVIKPTPPFHPSTHVVAKDNVKLTSKQKGDMFEHYVIHKFDSKYYLLKDMRSDKGSNGIYPESNQYPDLVLKYKPHSFEFAVECKWCFGWWLGNDTKQPPAKDGWVRGLAAESRDTGRPSPVVIKELVFCSEVVILIRIEVMF